MGYQLVVWEGERPADDDAGRQAFQRVTKKYFVDDPQPPSPAIRKFAEALIEIWPDDPADPLSERSPWKYVPLLHEASGPVMFVDLMLQAGVLCSTVVAAVAEEHGLVTYDLITGVLRPLSEAAVAEHMRRWSAPLN